MSNTPNEFDYIRVNTALCQWRPVVWLRGLVMATAGLGYVVLGPSISFAQYPGSAGNLNDGAFGGSSSSSSDLSGEASNTSGSVNSDATSNNSVSGSMTGSSSFAGGESSDGDYGYEGRTVTASPPRKDVRKRSLIRQFRLEFAKTQTVETANKRIFRASSADVYLDQFSKELDAGFNQQADLDSLGRDLSLVRGALDDRLNEVIANYGGDALRHDFFSTTASTGWSAPTLRTEVKKLKLKHELLEFGELSLQAMGYYAE
ncbi:MAG: hypothetical protein VX106_03530 [Pseudomonadota bacterium]|nr:hypothetical protein [Pseudomonadota bacterium]